MTQSDLDRLENIRQVYGGEYTLKFKVYLKLRKIFNRRNK